MNQTTLEVKRYPFGTASFNKIIDAYYMTESDCFEIRFANGTVYPLTNDELKKANKIKINSQVVNVEVDKEIGSGFYVHYSDGNILEASWELILEYPNKKQSE